MSPSGISLSGPFPVKDFLAPRYWLTWIGLGILWCIAQLPHRWQFQIGKLIGRMMYLSSRRRRHIAEINLKLCFPELDENQRAHLLKNHFASLGMGLVETAMSWWTSDARMRKLARIEGLEHLEEALRYGKGVILLSAHFTNLEIGTHLLAIHTRFHAMYRAHKNPLFDAVMKRAREARCEKAISSDDVRGMLNSLKQNIPVWYASDQNYGLKHSVFVPFFGTMAATNPAPSRLARLSGAPIVPFMIQRRDNRHDYLLTLLPAMEGIPGDDLKHDMLRISQLIETQVRKAPEQYLWVHRRFKDRPPGEDNFYEP